MNVFVLCTGRTGSTTFIRACKHITNYSAGHETRARKIGRERLNYPPNHIEADNRLSWFLGRLERRYGKEAYYVFLRRDRRKVAKSFNRRWISSTSILKAYNYGILMRRHKSKEVAEDMVKTVETNVEVFLEDKPEAIEIQLESAKEGFKQFWKDIGAEGDLERALKEWDYSYNSSSEKPVVWRYLKDRYLLLKAWIQHKLIEQHS